MKLLGEKLNQKGVRVVTLSSSAHSYGTIDINDMHFKNRDDRTYTRWDAYGQSKLANLLFAKSLADRFKGAVNNTIFHIVNKNNKK